MTALYYLRTGQEHGLSVRRLGRAAADYSGLGEDDPRLRAAKTERGKPYFPSEPLIHCSITHSGGVWLCALSSSPVGVDLQEKRALPSPKIAQRFFNPLETEFLAARPEMFFDVWCAKESYVKYTGEGMVCGLDGFSAVTGDGMAGRIGGAELRRVDFSPDFVLYVCGGSGEIVLKELPGGDIPVSNDDIGG